LYLARSYRAFCSPTIKSMQAAVRNPGRYALSGYFHGEGVPPTGAGGGWQNPSKAPAVPGQGVPAPQITASAAHPGRKSNNTIPYARVCSIDAARTAGRPGNVTFVSRNHSAYMGAGTERKSLMASLDLVNTRLSKRDDGKTTLAVGAGNPYYHLYRVTELQDWALDGVVLGNPDLANSNPTSDLVDGRLVATTPINVCVQGIASALNVFQPGRGGVARPGSLALLDEVFVGLFATREADHWSFQYHPFGVAALRDPQTQVFAGLGNLVGAWRVGKVIDTAASVGGWGAKSGKSEHRITLNVCIEWIPTKVQAPMHAWDNQGNYCFLPTLLMRYGDEKPMSCPNLVLNLSYGKPSGDGGEFAPPPAPGPVVPPPPAPVAPTGPIEPTLPEPLAAPAAAALPPFPDPQAFEDALQAANEMFDYAQLLAAVERALSLDITDPIENVVNDAYEFFSLDWSLDHAPVVRYIRAGGTQGLEGKMVRLKEWVVLDRRIKTAQTRGKQL